MNELIQKGVAALKAGDRDSAREWLKLAVKQDPGDFQAWLWLSGAVELDEERMDCLRQVLRLDPGNMAAARGLAQILERRTQPRDAVLKEMAAKNIVPPLASQPEPEQDEVDFQEALNRIVQPQRTATPAVETIPPSENPLGSIENDSASTQVADAQSLPDPQPAGGPAAARVVVSSPKRRTPPREGPGRPVFHARPSLVPVFLYFWVVAIGLWGINMSMQETPELGIPVTIALLIAIGLFILYIFARLFLTRYELTTHHLSLPFQGTQVSIPIREILIVEQHQSGFQKLLGVGDILLDAGVNGELASIRLHNVPQFLHRAEQILYLVSDQR